MKHKDNLSTMAGRQQRIHELAEAAQRIAQEWRKTEEISNYMEVMTYFKNPPYESEQANSNSKQAR
jgi:hypothetical protein